MQNITNSRMHEIKLDILCDRLVHFSKRLQLDKYK